MQPDLRRSSSKGSSQETPVSNGHLTRVAEMVNEGHTLYCHGALYPPGGVIQEPLVTSIQGKKRPWRPSPTLWHLTLIVGDGVLLIAVLALLSVIASPLHLGLKVWGYGLGNWNAKLLWDCLALVSWSMAVRITRAQELAYTSNRFRSPLRVLFALITMSIFLIGLTRLLTDNAMAASLRLELFFLLLAVPALSTWRVVLSECMRLPRFLPQAVIVGVNSAGETIARELQRAKHSGVKVLGFISERIDGHSEKNGLPILGSRSALHALMQQRFIDIIILTLDSKASPELFHASIEAAQLGVSVVPMPLIYESITGKIPVEHIGDQWYGSLPSEPIVSPLYMCWRKVMDFAFGLCGTVLLLLLVPILAPLIYLDSPGPIFYSQERVGYRGRRFFIHKFRSMETDAESSACPVWAAENDTRVTRIGRFLRTTHLDELPQALNILCGDMSLIGPRPERQEFVEQLEKVIPFYRCRLSVKPGLSGWAQVKYSYTSTDQESLVKLQHDLYYIKHQSFTLDILIILKTGIEMLLCRGR